MSSEGWLLLQVYPWFERYRNDPGLALAISQYEKKKARIADELREMVKRPEWRHFFLEKPSRSQSKLDRLLIGDETGAIGRR